MVGPGALAGHDRVGLDTSIFIYDWERHRTYGPISHATLTAVETGVIRAVASTLLIAELLVRPHRLGRPDVAAAYQQRLTRFPNLTLVPPGVEICERAAELRARVARMRLPDAIHIATATTSGATAFVTNDFDFAGDVGLIIVRLEAS